MNLSRLLFTTTKSNHRLTKPLASLFSTKTKRQPKGETKETITKWAEIEKGIPLLKSETTWPKPTEIIWQPGVANCINLIGEIVDPIEVDIAGDDEMYTAGAVLKHTGASGSGSGSEPLCVPIVFEGDLALIAANYLKPKDLVYIAGQISGDPPKFTMEQGQSTIQVLVKSLNYVQDCKAKKKCGVSSQHKVDSFSASDLKKQCSRSSQDNLDYSSTEISNTKKESLTSSQNDFDSSFSGSTLKDSAKVVAGESEESIWNDISKNPSRWVDYRNKKLNGMVSAKHPDFKHKDSRQSVWLSAAPSWFLSQLDPSDSSSKKVFLTEPVAKDGLSPESSWKDLIENANQWVDRRKDKRDGLVNPKYPDFTHTEGKRALWINTAPKWALDKLEKLELIQDSSKTIGKKDPASVEESWKDLVENLDRWWDNRVNKRNPRGPDFKHKYSDQALWLSNAPGWVLPKLPPVKSEDALKTTFF